MVKLVSGETHSKLIGAAAHVMVVRGLTDWTVELVAAQAGCAKGLVLYHFGTKNELLTSVAAHVHLERHNRRLAALAAGGAAALNRLWDVVRAEVSQGTASLWLQLVAHETSRTAASMTEDDRITLDQAAAAALDLSPDSSRLDDLLDTLNGFELALVQGRDADRVRDSYDRYWLGVLS